MVLDVALNDVANKAVELVPSPNRFVAAMVVIVDEVPFSVVVNKLVAVAFASVVAPVTLNVLVTEDEAAINPPMRFRV